MKRSVVSLGLVSLFTASAGLALVGCGDDDGGAGTGGAGSGGAGTGGAGTGGAGGSDTVAVSIDFEARVGDSAFDCAEMYEVGTPATMVHPLDFRFYVHDVALRTSSGEQSVTLDQNAFQNGEVALLDFEDDTGTCSNGTSQTHTTLTGTVPTGEYTGLSFVIGVPEARNHVQNATAPSPLNLEGMFWSWTTGYKFLRIDVAPMMVHTDAGPGDDDAGMPMHGGGAFNVHLGATMCSGDPSMSEPVTCMHSNRPTAQFASFDPTTQKIVVDLATLLENSNLAHDGGGAPGCMSGGADPECGPIFDALGVNLSTGAEDGTPRFLRVVDK